MNLSNISLLGDRVLIQLDEHPEHTVTAVGVVVPKFISIETDGGKPKQKPSNQKYISSGTVIAISHLASEKLPIAVGDKVYVNPQAVSQNYHFLISRNNLVDDFDGVISLPHALIEAKIIN